MMVQNFFAVASRHAEWAATRRTVIASNIANANTPGYKARDIEAFSAEMTRIAEPLHSSHPSHIAVGDAPDFLITPSAAPGGQEYHTGNNVSLDRELLKAGATSREQNLNTGLMKAFNRLIALSTRG